MGKNVNQGYQANYQQYAAKTPSYGKESILATPNYQAAETTTANSTQPIQTADDVTLIIVVAVIGTLVLILILCGGIIFWLALRLKRSQKSNRQSNTDTRAIASVQSEEYDDVAPAPPAEINIYEEIASTLHYDYVTNPPQPPELCTRPVFSSPDMPPYSEIVTPLGPPPLVPAEYDDVGPVEKEQHCEYVEPAGPSKAEKNEKHSDEEQYLKILP
ncbi:Hypothetical predicted protein [Cloeon dipterum]|uniref:Uncharacterized protein n=1 Tax=Cloeon dipterum TaxID=197152 RepID=A0A8S1DZ86_9INSE|nr:Hypothetical predicted protein [Cloeon dipterum]